VREALPAGGLLGTLMSHGLRSGFNVWGANLVAIALLVVALFLATSFSFSGAHAWASGAKGPLGRVEKLGILQRAQARWHAWQDEREQRRMAGRKPVTPQIVGKGETAEKSEVEEVGEVEEAKEASHKAPILFLNNEKGLADIPGRAKKPDPKIAKMNANYKLPSISLLKQGEGSQKLDEDELKLRARAIEAKCHEFEVEGRVTQINPGPVVTTFEFKPEAGI